MAPTDANKLILTMATIVSGVGALDAAVGRDMDLLMVFSLGVVLQLALLLRLSVNRPPIPLRADLVAWLRDRAAQEGETLETVADRCVASCRADLDAC
jgi:hypothetical protein